MNKFNPSFVVTAVNSTSALVTVALPAGLTITGKGKSTSATLVAADLDQIVTSSRDRVAVVVNGNGPFEVIVAPPAGGTLTPRLNALAADLAVKINAVAGGAAVTATRVGSTVEVTSALTTEASAVQFLDASSSSATSALKLGVANGGTEVEGAAGFRPRQTGTTGVIAPTMTAAAPLPAANVDVNVVRGAATVNAAPIPLAWLTSLTTPEEAVAALGDALRKSSDPLLAGATISLVGGVLRLLPGPADPSLSLDIVVSAPAKALGFDPAGVRNVARYGPAGFDQLAQVNTAVGSNGTKPSATELTGDELAKTGIYALEKVDLFNLLVMPDDEVTGSVYSEAIAYCTRRRAFMIIDAPQTVNTFAEAEKWINKDASVLRSRNSALYFPRLRLPDPQMNGALGTFPAAGALAGLYARTDAERGVWKAPAGTTATIVGATGLSVALTDDENGKLNPFGLNCLRLFPVIGTVSWGARTGNGADVKADEYKYIPVRRLALFLEESLYRGTQWVVFEPNDEPLWSQIRLNLGAFMQNLFISGAFQGRTARDAFFVKCDKETTTQNDIDLGRVNIVVGFAPLKPAEFVVIKIQQIAGAIRT